MPDIFSSELLAALNELVGVKDNEQNSIAAVLRGPLALTDLPSQERETASENRFAATISSGMARVRDQHEW
jgi:hypothetical protein